MTMTLEALIIAVLIAGLLVMRRQRGLRAARAMATLFNERELFSTTLGRIGDAVIATDLQHRITFLSPVAEQLTGWSLAESKGQPIETVFQMVREDSRMAVENPIVRALRDGSIVGLTNHTILLSRAGTERPIEDMAAPLHDAAGRVNGAVLIFRDVSVRRETETKLNQFVAELSERDHRNSEFIAVLAHELRNPLAPIRAALEIMRLAPEDARSVESARDVMGRQLGQMVHLIDDLLDVSRLTRGSIELHRERIALSEIIRVAVDTAMPQLRQYGVVLSIAQPSMEVVLDVDSIRVTQAISNVLNNAAKFTDRGGHVWLTVTVDQATVIIGIRDDGIGIALDQRERIFDMFTQVDGTLERSRDGLGIGLTLVRKLLELHGGSIDVQGSGLGQGSEFVLRIPRAAAVSRPSRLNSASAEGVAGTLPLRILVVDDNRDSADSLSVVLRLTGHTVEVAYDGRTGLVAAEAFRPDVLLLDIGMPELNGYEVAERIRAAPWGSRIMLVALTGWGQATDRERSAKAGFHVHLVKPVDFAMLTKLLSSVKDPTATTPDGDQHARS